MDIGAPGQIFRRNLDDRPHHNERPGRSGLSDLAQQVDVHALIDHAVKSEARMRQPRLVRGIARGRGVREVRAVNAGGEGVDIAVAAPLGFK